MFGSFGRPRVKTFQLDDHKSNLWHFKSTQLHVKYNIGGFFDRHLSIMNVNTVQCSAGTRSISLNEVPDLYISILASIFRPLVCICMCIHYSSMWACLSACMTAHLWVCVCLSVCLSTDSWCVFPYKVSPTSCNWVMMFPIRTTVVTWPLYSSLQPAWVNLPP